MNSTICNNCRLSLRLRLRRVLRPSHQQTKSQSTAAPSTLTRGSRTQPASNNNKTHPDLASLLSQPTWSVRSLLPPAATPQAPSIPPKTLHHLLRLSALPQPRTADEESQMLATLSSQLHFVRAIQGVDTTGVAPLRAIRDETAAGLREQTVGLAELREALEAEDVVGHARRPRRRLTQQQRRQSSLSAQEGGGGEEEEVIGRDIAGAPNGTRGQERTPTNAEEDWDVLGGASETAGGRYFVVRSGGTGSLPNETVG
ncbi:hypothetical protein F5Y12DRAFT_104714 [Xylaria sp. FL1777]|nr:hypothetical protein F5Y12DRAFT_104714 [Xylaria sp. FL1777]